MQELQTTGLLPDLPGGLAGGLPGAGAGGGAGTMPDLGALMGMLGGGGAAAAGLGGFGLPPPPANPEQMYATQLQQLQDMVGGRVWGGGREGCATKQAAGRSGWLRPPPPQFQYAAHRPSLAPPQPLPSPGLLRPRVKHPRPCGGGRQRQRGGGATAGLDVGAGWCLTAAVAASHNGRRSMRQCAVARPLQHFIVLHSPACFLGGWSMEMVTLRCKAGPPQHIERALLFDGRGRTRSMA